MLKIDAATYYQGVTSLMRHLGRSRILYYKWDDKVPEPYATKIEHDTGGQLKANVDTRQCYEVKVTQREVVR
jgi:hypothetical protein